MPSNISTIESLLQAADKPLSIDDIAISANVVRTSVTSAITRLSRSRPDLLRVTHQSKTYYGFGPAKFTGHFSLPVGGAATGRDMNGKFTSLNKNTSNALQAANSTPAPRSARKKRSPTVRLKLKLHAVSGVNLQPNNAQPVSAKAPAKLSIALPAVITPSVPVAVATAPKALDQFRGWFNPATGIRASRLG